MFYKLKKNTKCDNIFMDLKILNVNLKNFPCKTKTMASRTAQWVKVTVPDPTT